MECSARTLHGVADVFATATRLVMYPMRPLFDVKAMVRCLPWLARPCPTRITHCGSALLQRITSRYRNALDRVFRVFDEDNDGLLSEDEVCKFQVGLTVPQGGADEAGEGREPSLPSPHTIGRDALHRGLVAASPPSPLSSHTLSCPQAVCFDVHLTPEDLVGLRQVLEDRAPGCVVGKSIDFEGAPYPLPPTSTLSPATPYAHTHTHTRTCHQALCT